MPNDETEVDIEGHAVRLSNLNKVFYPEVSFTKGQIIDYYARIAPVLLPHLYGRPLTLKRYPNGVRGMHFYEKNCPSHRPGWVQTARVWSSGSNRWMQYCLVQDLATLVWCANLADIELHTSLSLGSELLRPTVIVFDLDPGAPASMVQCCRVGLWVRDIFAQLGLQSFAKTSGSKGLQIYIPLNTPVTYEETKPFAHELARLLERQHPELVVSEMKKAVRAGKIFVDWSQNDDHKTTVCVYSLRAKERPTVSTPVGWEEVERCLAESDPELLVFTSEQVLARVANVGDLFAPVLSLKQKLPPVSELARLGPEGIGSPIPKVVMKQAVAARERQPGTATKQTKAASLRGSKLASGRTSKAADAVKSTKPGDPGKRRTRRPA